MRVGGRFKLDCIATNDPQSPNVLEFKWFKGSNRINNDRYWIIVIFMDYYENNKIISRLFNTNTVDHQLSGRYTCSVYDSMITRDIEQSTNVIIEGKQMLHVCNLILNIGCCFIVPVVITTDPQAVVVAVSGESVTLSCNATGSNPIRYQWRRISTFYVES